MCTRIDGDPETREAVIESSVWRIQTIQNLISLINSNQHDIAARSVVDSTYKELKVKVSSLIRHVDESITLEDVANMLYPNIKGSIKEEEKSTKGQRLKRTLEKQCNKLIEQIKAWKSRVEKASIKARAIAQESFKVSSVLFLNFSCYKKDCIICFKIGKTYLLTYVLQYR
ncbi:hypothetical protein RDABS01_025788 [Bienertia sinuspersici]